MIAILHGLRAFGAVERYVEAVVAGLRERGREVLLVHVDDPVLEPFARLEGGSVRIERTPVAVEQGGTVALTLHLARLLRRHRPRVVHVAEVWPAAQAAARLAGVRRLLLTHHTPELPRRDNLAGRMWQELGWAVRPEVIYTSEQDRAADGRTRLRTHVVGLGIDLDRFDVPRAPHAGSVIGSVARLAPQKGLDTLLDALPLVRGARPEARLVLAGDGELRGELERRAATLGLGEAVTFTGHVDDVPAVLAGLDVFAFPSRFEGLCLAVIEAQAAGVPVVATPVGGIRETVIDGETGLLVPVDDAPALAQAVGRLLDDPSAAAELAAEARRRVRARFSIERMVEGTIALYG